MRPTVRKASSVDAEQEHKSLQLSFIDQRRRYSSAASFGSVLFQASGHTNDPFRSRLKLPATLPLLAFSVVRGKRRVYSGVTLLA